MNAGRTGKAIGILRRKAGLTQRQLADRLLISDKAVSKWERGLSFPDVSLLGKLSIILDSDIESIIEGNAYRHEHQWKGVLNCDDGLALNTLVGGKSLISILLCYFLLVGIRGIAVICGEGNLRYLTDCLDEFSALGLSIEPISRSKDSWKRELENYISPSHMLYIDSRCFLYGLDLTKCMQRAMIARDGITVLALVKGMDKSGAVMFNEDRLIVAVSESHLRTSGGFHRIPFLFCPDQFCHDLIRNDFTTDGNKTYVELVGRGMVNIEMNCQDAVNDVAVFMNVVEKNMGLRIYDIKEVSALRVNL